MNHDDVPVLTRRQFVSLTAAIPTVAVASAYALAASDSVAKSCGAAIVTAAVDMGVQAAGDAASSSWLSTYKRFEEQIRLARAMGVGSMTVSLDAAPTPDALFRNWLRLRQWVSRTEEATLQTGVESTPSNHVRVIACLRDTQRFATQLDDLGELRASGIAVMGLACDWKGPYGDGALERSNLSLTSLGARAVKRMNAERIVIDVARMGRRGSLEVITSSADPTIISHTNAAALQEHPLNATDEQIKACAARGGVIGIGHSPSPAPGEHRARAEETIRHIEHVINLVGIDHVGLAVLEIEPIVDGLRTRGLSDRQIGQVAGGNLRRVFRQVWERAVAGDAP